jgi:hypothetical protein
MLMSVLAGEDATLDSLHLSEPGHRQLAESVGAMIEVGGAN